MSPYQSLCKFGDICGLLIIPIFNWNSNRSPNAQLILRFKMNGKRHLRIYSGILSGIHTQICQTVMNYSEVSCLLIEVVVEFTLMKVGGASRLFGKTVMHTI